MKSFVTASLLIVTVAVASSHFLHAQAADKAKVMDSYGTVQKRASATAAWENVNVGDLLAVSASVKTGANAAVLLQLPDAHVMRLGPSTTMEIKQVGKDKNFLFNVAGGKVWSFVQSASRPTKFEVETPSAVAGVSGTLFSVFHDEESNETTVSTDEGEVNVRHGDKTVKVGKGNLGRFAHTAAGGTPRSDVGKAMEQPEKMKALWQHMREHENWMSTGGGHKLDRDRRIETHLRELDQHRGEELRGKGKPAPGKRPPGKGSGGKSGGR